MAASPGAGPSLCHWQFKLVTPAACWPRAAVDGHGVSGAGTGSGGEVTADGPAAIAAGGGGGGGGGFVPSPTSEALSAAEFRLVEDAMRAHIMMRAPVHTVALLNVQ